VARSGHAIELTLRFPDAARPSEVLGSNDNRLLGISLHRIALFQTEPVPDTLASGNPARRSRGEPESGAVPPQSWACEKSETLVVARLTEVLREAFRLPGLDYHGRTVLRKISGYDTTRFVRFVLGLEAEFGITLHEDDVDRIATMGDVLAVLQAKVRDRPVAQEMAR
jgi:hypothetical protein